jgi:RNase P subunit RPR2
MSKYQINIVCKKCKSDFWFYYNRSYKEHTLIITCEHCGTKIEKKLK